MTTNHALTWKDLLPVISAALPQPADPDVAADVALAVENELLWRSQPRTVEQRVARVLLEHIQVTQDQVPGATVANPCMCGWGEWGAPQGSHVAEKLREAGLLAAKAGADDAPAVAAELRRLADKFAIDEQESHGGAYDAYSDVVAQLRKRVNELESEAS